MPVVVGAGSGGVLLHEAVGHGLEGDFNRQGTSLYSGRIGERVASDLVTIYDDGNLMGERGSLSVDDEGATGRHTVLVERGILRGYMQDYLNGRLMSAGTTGNGRRQSFRFLPQPRMCNTYMPAGESTFDEIVGSVSVDLREVVRRRPGRDQQGRFRVHARRGLPDRGRQVDAADSRSTRSATAPT